ncbi:conserved hypothetical protein [Frankia sp. Hr75.2]|nr:conserved hypothetical protein [Frankia sp. Hr75.2]
MAAAGPAPSAVLAGGDGDVRGCAPPGTAVPPGLAPRPAWSRCGWAGAHDARPGDIQAPRRLDMDAARRPDVAPQAVSAGPWQPPAADGAISRWERMRVPRPSVVPPAG